MAKDIVVRIRGDHSDLSKSFAASEHEAKGFGGRLTSIFQGVGQGIGQALASVAGGALGAGIGLLGGAVKAASDFNETVSKTATIFGSDQMNGLLDWADGAANAMGQTRQQALDAASTFATFGKTAGLSGGDLSDFAQDLTGLSSDFASFFNTSPEDAIAAIGAALRGESEPIRKFGVMLSEETLKATALSKGLVRASVDTEKFSNAQEASEKAARKAAEMLKKHGANSVEYTDAVRDQEQAEAKLAAVMEGKVPDLTQAQKMQAAYLSILDQSTAAQGDFARTSDGLANKQRILAARFQNAKQELGAAFLPVMLKGVDIILTHVIPAFDKFAEWVGKVVYLFRDAGWQEAAKEILGKVGEAFAAVGAWLRDTAGPAIWAAVQELAKMLVAWVKDPAIPWLLEHLGEWLSSLGGWLVDTALPWLWEKTKELAHALADWVKDSALPWLLEHLGEWLGAFAGWVGGTLLPWLGDQAVKLWHAFSDWVDESAQALKKNLPVWLETFVKWVVGEAIPSAVAKMAEFGAKMADWVAGAAVDLLSKLPGWLASFHMWVATSAVPAVAGFGVTIMKSLASGMWSALNFMGDIASAIVDGLISGLWRLSGRLASSVRDFVAATIPGPVKDLLGINSPSQVFFEFGQQAVEGLRLGMEAGRMSLTAASAGVAQSTAQSGSSMASGGFAATAPTVVLNGVVAGSEQQLAAYLSRALRTYNVGRR